MRRRVNDGPAAMLRVAAGIASRGAARLRGERRAGRRPVPPPPSRAAPRSHHPSPSLSVFTNQVFFNGATLSHPIPGGSEPLAQPDDIAFGDGHIFVAFQNGVGPQGQASPSGNLDSTVVELDLGGNAVHQWDVIGKVDGVTADPYTGLVVATVNEDANSSLYTIDPQSGAIVHYGYNEPLPSDGGTDAISFYEGMMLISASAPGTTGLAAPQPTYPAVFEVTLESATQVASVAPLFYDESSATLANFGPGFGSSVTLGLTDPDSNEDVPFLRAALRRTVHADEPGRSGTDLRRERRPARPEPVRARPHRLGR
jgi:hypothetical protein